MAARSEINDSFYVEALRRLEAREARGKKRGRPNALREELLSTARCDFEARAVVVAAPAPAAQLVPVVPSQLAVLKRQVAAISCETVGIITSDRGLTMNRIDSAVRDLLAAVSGDGAAGDLLDEDLLRILNHLQESSLKSLRWMSLSSQLSVLPQKLVASVQRLATLLCSMSRLSRLQLEDGLRSSFARQNLVLYEEYSRYDETPLWLVLKDFMDSFLCSESKKIQVDLQHYLGSATLDRKTDAAPVKVMNCKNGAGMVIRVGDQYVRILCQTVVSIRPLAANAIKSTAASQLSVSAASDASSSFSSKSRVTCTDAHASNLRHLIPFEVGHIIKLFYLIRKVTC